MLDVRPCHDEPRIVPFADRPRDIAHRRLQSVIGAGGGQRVLAVRVTGVVEDLHLGSALPHLGADIHHAKDDAAVAAFGDLPLQPQIEIAELVDGDDVAAGSGSRQRSVNHGPTRRRRI